MTAWMMAHPWMTFWLILLGMLTFHDVVVAIVKGIRDRRYR